MTGGTGALPAWAGIPQPTTVEPATGSRWVPQPGSRVVPDGPGPAREAERLGAELGLPVGDAAGPGDVFLRVAAGDAAECYRVDVTDRVVVTGADAAGVFRGTRQVLHTLTVHGALPPGTAAGRPAVPERALHLDAARKHFTAAWVETLLHEMAHVGLNVLQWHFSEDEGFRIESERHPEVVSPGALGQDEVRRLLAVADDLHVRVAPSLSMPGHLGQVLRAHPAHRLPGGASGALDLTDEAAVALALDLVDEYAGLFRPGTTWNIGADEFVDLADLAAHPALAETAERRFGVGATGFDLLVDFVNRVAAVVRERGYRPQVWNDGMFRSTHVPLDRDVRVAWWTGWSPRMAPLSAALDRGYEVLNVNDSVLYFVLGEHAGYRYPTAASVAGRDWHPGLFADRRDTGHPEPQELATPYPPQLRGAMFAIWCDRPEARTAAQVAADVRGPLRAVAERAWNAGSRLGPAVSAALDRAIGRASAASAVADLKG
jgi:hexosaminidase